MYIQKLWYFPQRELRANDDPMQLFLTEIRQAANAAYTAFHHVKCSISRGQDLELGPNDVAYLTFLAGINVDEKG